MKVKKPTPSWMDPKNDTKPPVIIRTLLLATIFKYIKTEQKEEKGSKGNDAACNDDDDYGDYGDDYGSDDLGDYGDDADDVVGKAKDAFGDDFGFGGNLMLEGADDDLGYDFEDNAFVELADKN